MRFIIVLAWALCSAGTVLGQDRQTVLFEITQATSFGQSVFVLGDIPELGADDLTRAIKLDPSAYPTWRVSVAVPEGVTYAYRYYLRSDGPGQTSSPTNGTPVTGVLTGSVPASADAVGKTVVVRAPESAGTLTLRWRGHGATTFESATMERLGPGSTLGSAEHFAFGVGADHASDAYGMEFFIESAGGFREPLAGTLTAHTEGVFVQQGDVFAYRPSASVSAARRDYAPSSPPTIFSNAIGETRRYRVYLPRGYDEHTDRTYPLVFFHDGQNIFEFGSFGTWNADDAIDTTTRDGRVREAVYVGVDHADRFRDFIPGPGADNYVSFLTDELTPLIAGAYRVRTGAPDVGSIGSSLGGVIAMEMGWNHPDDFGLVGAVSGAWQVTTTTLNPQLESEPARDVRLYMDSGDSGPSDDNYWRSYNLRDALAGSTAPRYALGGSLQHVVGFGDVHNEAAWNRRLPGVLGFLLPAGDAENGVINSVVGPQLDRDRDGLIGVEDLYEQEAASEDLNNDGVIDRLDTSYLIGVVRRNEAGTTAAP